ncbi:hypothetical protein IGI04_005460 [Brassica rapa subsp. trilocularis]|uniref:Srp40 C-terminal domain-containing protein n=1 Tax=Brassica rapa subsp. trilocularis TaxID=1813537 RepID=A0ABQ7NE24_BRACM|nr:hypothetical protein IGI04_005460 [Brassica rapa subsp. trilocularis]
MPKTLATEPSSRNTLNPALLALTPRQVLISRPVMAKESKALSLKSEQKAILLRSVAQYLERCGFSKCFKKLLSEAEIEKKELNSALPDLEEVYGVFLSKSNLEAVEVKDESGDQKKEVGEVSAMEGVEKVKKEKKKKKKKVEVPEEEKVKETDAEVEDGVEEKKIKKKKNKEPKVEEVKETDGEIEDGVKEKKKKKKNKSKATEAETLLGDEEKVSKKRKRSEPEEETKEQTEDDDEDSKRRKKVAEDDMGVQETPVKQQNDVQENGNFETKSTDKKSGKGLSNSKEPKKPFQRVNVEEVVFTDDRLKDNSYWAKGGADSGYGAKAQEVLGQVRGRGFRHEKTKKKRGSYRGGEIDLQSHSVKFEYSDDE